MPRVGTETMTSLLVPLPPLEEQRRIVEKIDEVASAVSAYDVAYRKTETLNSAFPESLKKSILQEAVQGKLVPQDPSDESAEALLERIRAEKQRLIKEGKIKKDKHNLSFSDGIILIMKSWTALSAVSTMNCPLRYQIHGIGFG